MHLAAALELCKLKDRWQSAFSQQATTNSRIFQDIVDSLLHETENLLNSWFTARKLADGFGTLSSLLVLFLSSPFVCLLLYFISSAVWSLADFIDHLDRPGFLVDQEQILKWCMLDFILVIHRYKIAHNDMDQGALDQCLSTSDAITSIIEKLAQTGALTYIQDTSSCMTSSMVTLLVKVRCLMDWPLY